MNDNLNEKFMTLWISIFEENNYKLKLEEAERLIEDGADINKPRGEFGTPLYYVVMGYCCSRNTYMNNEFLDELLFFLFSKNVFIDKESIRISMRDPKLLSELLMRVDDIDTVFSSIDFQYIKNSLCLETIIGFSAIKLDEYVSYYFSKYYYSFLLIECVLLDYCLGIDERRDVIRILKKHGSPSPSRDRLNIIEKKNENDNRFKKRFQEIIKYWEDLEY
jgi:hypothetical protein